MKQTHTNKEGALHGRSNMNAQSTLQREARAKLKRYSASTAGAPARSNSIIKFTQIGATWVEVDILLKFIQIGATCCLYGHTFNLLHRHSLLPLPLLHLSVTYFLFVFKFLLLVLLTHLLLHMN